MRGPGKGDLKYAAPGGGYDGYCTFDNVREAINEVRERASALASASPRSAPPLPPTPPPHTHHTPPLTPPLAGKARTARAHLTLCALRHSLPSPACEKVRGARGARPRGVLALRGVRREGRHRPLQVRRQGGEHRPASRLAPRPQRGPRRPRAAGKPGGPTDRPTGRAVATAHP